jgi:hypothetical protein
MKKILSIACLAIVVAALASCKKEYITNVSQTPNQTWLSKPVVTSDWSQTKDGKADSVSIVVKPTDFFNTSDATLVYFSFSSGVFEQIPEVYNGTSYSYFHYSDNAGLHLVLYAQPVNGGVPVKPALPITVKLVLIPSITQ